MNGTLKTARDIAQAKLIAPARVDALAAVAARYAVAVTPALAALIDRDDPDDPIARQFVPNEAELQVLPEERADPIGDRAHSPVRGIVHRHRDRVLLKIVHACPVYCRFCFRREMVGPDGDGALSEPDLQTALDYIDAHPQIWEVIMTGGDPFVLSARRIAELTQCLAGIAHLRVLRWHTRMPVAIPETITSELISAIVLPQRATYVALHANHPRELTPAARAACARIIDAGIPMLSQTVLLKGVNDDIDTLEELMRAFVEARIKPYYLHHPDLAPGTSHFRVGIERGQELVRLLRARASGLCQPEYVLDIPGGYAKARIADPDFEATREGHFLSDHASHRHVYPPTGGGAA
ncbi:MAG TPA: lysine-2,3-aminomutase-like protein [Rhizomicrobium sp.]|jgi:lysine 2,3-aminomutase|nr:lysine-2,3-aminomutase-like protein [Rhizomicrobium sp.]